MSLCPDKRGTREDIVIVTGFGPFSGHKVNASWEAVKLLPTLGTEKELGIRLITEEIPVAYQCVAEKVPDLWEKHKPLLVAHVGVSSVASELTLELTAHKSGYCLADVEGQLPPRGECCHGRDEKIEPSLDVEHISNEVNKANLGVLACVSTNAGRYLCEFIYYTSLSIDKSRTIFIHVPELHKPYSAQELALGIKKILSVMVEEMRCRVYGNSIHHNSDVLENQLRGQVIL